MPDYCSHRLCYQASDSHLALLVLTQSQDGNEDATSELLEREIIAFLAAEYELGKEVSAYSRIVGVSCFLLCLQSNVTRQEPVFYLRMPYEGAPKGSRMVRDG